MNTTAFIQNPPLGAALAADAMLLFAACSITTASVMRRLDTDAGALIAALVNVPLGIMMVLGQLAFLGALQPPSVPGVLGFLLAGVFSTYLGRWLFFKSIESAGPTRATSFQTSSPLITALLGWIFLGQVLSPLALTGIALGVLGLATTVLGSRRANPSATQQHLRQQQADLRSFVLIGLGSSTAYAISHVLRAGAIGSWNEPVAGVALGACTGTLALVLVHRRQLAPLRQRIAAQPRAAFAYAGVGCMQILAQVCMVAALAHIPASIAALIALCSPLVVMPASLLLFRNREGIGLFVVLGMLITMGGVALTLVRVG
ncbi:DMT family transporter [Comamonadaceae bacterium G21597-S1]|nr:DMT family transporter [Comamonadaceae bacterium G21597-S1]